MRQSGLLLFIIAVFTTISFSPVFADPQSLVCKWESAVPGDGWKVFFQGKETSDDLFIKIKKVEGNKAWGEIYIAGRQSYHNQWHKFEATLSEVEGGIAIDFQVSTFIVVHLEAVGDKMTGTGLATVTANLKLKKSASCDN